jgi:Uma2 family endonuclease
MSIDADGPPTLIIEVLSESTFETDLDLERGKAYSYAHAGVAEYLVIDPTGQILPESIYAWRLKDGSYQPWRAAADHRWHSEQLPVALAVEGIWAKVYSTVTGEAMLLESQIRSELERLRKELGALGRD